MFALELEGALGRNIFTSDLIEGEASARRGEMVFLSLLSLSPKRVPLFLVTESLSSPPVERNGNHFSSFRELNVRAATHAAEWLT